MNTELKKKIDEALLDKVLIDVIKSVGHHQEMKKRFKILSSQMQSAFFTPVTSIVNQYNIAAFGNFPVLNADSLPVSDETIKEFLNDDVKDKKENYSKPKNKKARINKSSK